MVIKTDLPAVVGSSGLVGSFLINNLSVLYPKVISYSRRKIHFDKKNVKNLIIDFNNLENESSFKEIDHLYIALGTTRRKAGSDKNFELVDYHYCINLARSANKMGVKRISVISSVGSDPDSVFLYPRTKGMLEREIIKIPLDHLNIVKPGIILGERIETRVGENLGKIFFFLIDKILFGSFKKYKSISANDISKAMIFQLVNSKKNLKVLYYSDLKKSSNSFQSLYNID